jgi:hypothetical protein
MTEQIKSNDEFEDWLEGDYISVKPGETRNLCLGRLNCDVQADADTP